MRDLPPALQSIAAFPVEMAAFAEVLRQVAYRKELLKEGLGGHIKKQWNMSRFGAVVDPGEAGRIDQ